MENWGQVSLSENELMKRVFEIIDNSDALLIEFSEGGVGIGIEAGYAKAKNIPIYVLQSKKTGALSSAMKGTCNAWYEYETDDELQSILDSLVKE